MKIITVVCIILVITIKWWVKNSSDFIKIIINSDILYQLKKKKFHIDIVQTSIFTPSNYVKPQH